MWPFALQTKTQSPSDGEKTFSASFMAQPVENNTYVEKTEELTPQEVITGSLKTLLHKTQKSLGDGSSTNKTTS